MNMQWRLKTSLFLETFVKFEAIKYNMNTTNENICDSNYILFISFWNHKRFTKETIPAAKEQFLKHFKLEDLKTAILLRNTRH